MKKPSNELVIGIIWDLDTGKYEVAIDGASASMQLIETIFESAKDTIRASINKDGLVESAKEKETKLFN